MKTFTVEQANRTLPLVSRIVGDIVALYPRWRERVRQYELRAAGARADRPDPRAQELERELLGLQQEIEGCRRELEALGVQLKDYAMGLVDFPGEIGGRAVCLCWRFGEPAVEHWHECNAGFAGRQPLRPHAVT